MKTILFLFALLPMLVNAQRHFTRTGEISFYSSTPIEDIEAYNKSANSVIDLGTGAIQFAVQLKSFTFEKALMQEHFNENYVESDIFPKAVFKGKIKDLGAVDLDKDQTIEVVVPGTMELHGVTKNVEAKGTLTVKGGKLSAKSSFMINPEDYDIEIPGVVREKIAKEIEVKVNIAYAPLKK